MSIYYKKYYDCNLPAVELTCIFWLHPPSVQKERNYEAWQGRVEYLNMHNLDL